MTILLDEHPVTGVKLVESLLLAADDPLHQLLVTGFNGDGGIGFNLVHRCLHDHL